MVHGLRAILRLALAPYADPSGVTPDNCTVRSKLESGLRACFGGRKKRKGSKVHFAVVKLRNSLVLVVAPGDEQDRAQAAQLVQSEQAVVEESVQQAIVVRLYTGEEPVAATRAGLELHVVRHVEPRQGVVLLPSTLGGGAVVCLAGEVGGISAAGFWISGIRHFVPQKLTRDFKAAISG